ncbi:MAG TPA: BrnT family toxin [Devosia sp.]|nr:BrnT family toxin [Devosia sp.]
MEIEFDPAKDQSNIAKHGISLARAAELEDLTVEPDDRFDYGEARFRSWGFIDDLPYFFAFATRNGRVRAISLRRAHRKEIMKNAP